MEDFGLAFLTWLLGAIAFKVVVIGTLYEKDTYLKKKDERYVKVMINVFCLLAH